ncbi:MAG: aminotransferase class V-fold PLP-dependent enzyme [Pirellulaceae bacterium]
MTQTTPITRRIDVDADWQDLAELFSVREDTIYLNHGSFGIAPEPVRQARRRWIDQLDCQPMDFYVRELEPLVANALKKLGQFTGTDASNLVFAENATFAMNIVASSFPLQAGDEVLTNNHEYGAVQRIWDRATERAGATNIVARLPDSFESHEQIVDCLMGQTSERTRLLVVSHITSPTALIMPVEAICREAARRGIAVCIDGPHAPAHVPLDLERIGCDFYTASCHKWLSASLGSGFLYAHPRHHDQIQPPLLSWGRLLPARPERWFEEFIWPGTRDPSCYLSVGPAIDFMESVGLETFRERVRWMTRRTSDQLMDLTGKEPIGKDINLWYGSMAHVPLPDGDWQDLQQQLWEQHAIEVPIIDFDDRWYVRVSHHLYTTQEHVSQLLAALQRAFAAG